MKIKLLITTFFTLCSLSFAQNESEFEAKVELIQPLIVKVKSDLDFGNIIAGTSNNYPIQNGRVKISGVPYNVIDLKIKIKNENTHNQYGSLIPLENKYNEKIYTRMYYDITQGYSFYSSSNYEVLLFDENGIIEMVITGIIDLPTKTRAGRYSQILEFSARYD
ncbi:hypothetical protein [Fusobacterium sp. MFO224]|uniref:hypothetical protein n=1 Tax=Fusobacterium sp. MFO224 TaxID=3378070 RepID=UPI00385537BE